MMLNLKVPLYSQCPDKLQNISIKIFYSRMHIFNEVSTHIYDIFFQCFSFFD